MLSGYEGAVHTGVSRRGGHSEQTSSRPEESYQHYTLEFAPAPFAYNGRVLALMVPFIIPVLSFAGPHAGPLALAGLIGIYTFDYLNSRIGAIMAVWATALSLWFCMYFHNVALIFDTLSSIFVFGMAGISLCIYAALASLQFTWLQTSAPEIVIFLERLVLCLTPCVTAPLAFSAILPHTRPAHLPLYLAAICALLHYLFAAPLKSSFKHALAPSATFEALAVGRLDAAILTVYLIALPCIAGLGVQHELISSRPRIVLDSFTAAFVVSLSILVRPTTGLWFLSKSPAALRSVEGASAAARSAAAGALGLDVRTVEMIRRVLLVGGGIVSVLGLHYRLVFGSYAYLFTGVEPPFNFILVGVGVASGVGSLVLMSQVLATPVQPVDVAAVRPRQAASADGVAFGIMRSFSRRKIHPFVAVNLMVTLIVCIISLGVATGMSGYFMLWIIVGVSHLYGYMADSDPSTWPPVVLSIAFVSVVVSVAFFAIIAEQLPVLAGALTLSSDFVGWLYTLFTLVATHLFHMCVFTTPNTEGHPAAYTQRAFGIGFNIMAGAFTILEHVIYTSAEEDVYPTILVIATSILGCYTAYRLLTNCKLTLPAAAAAIGILGGKLLLFLSSEIASGEADIVEGSDLTLLGLSVLAFSLTAMATVGIAAMLVIEASFGLRRADPHKILLAFLSVSGACIVCARRTVVAAIVEAATGTSGLGTDVDPFAQSTLLGACLILWGITVGALVWPLFHRQKAFTRIAAGLVACGVALGALRAFINGVAPEVEYHAQRGLLVTSPTVAAVLIGVALVLLGLVATKVVPMPRREVRFLLWIAISAVAAFGFAGAFLPLHSFSVVWILLGYFLAMSLSLDFSCLQMNASSDATPPARVARDIALVAVGLNVVLAVLAISDFSVAASLIEEMPSFVVDELHDVAVSAILATGAASSIVACAMVRMRIARAEDDITQPGRGGSVGVRAVTRAARRALTPASVSDLSLVINLLMVAGILQVNLLNFVALDANIPLIVASSGLVLLFHDPSEESAGLLYVFMLVYIDAALFARTISTFGASASAQNLIGDVFVAILAVPAHALVLHRWLRDDVAPLRARARSDQLLTVLFAPLALVSMLWTPIESVRWFAAVGPFIIQ